MMWPVELSAAAVPANDGQAPLPLIAVQVNATSDEECQACQ
jgi:hypothetical protein